MRRDTHDSLMRGKQISQSEKSVDRNYRSVDLLQSQAVSLVKHPAWQHAARAIGQLGYAFLMRPAIALANNHHFLLKKGMMAVINPPFFRDVCSL
jgi:hypothetical protein